MGYLVKQDTEKADVLNVGSALRDPKSQRQWERLEQEIFVPGGRRSGQEIHMLTGHI